MGSLFLCFIFMEAFFPFVYMDSYSALLYA